MPDAGQDEINRLILEAIEHRRGYADAFSWPNREIEEWGVVSHFLRRELERDGQAFFREVLRRGRGRDPPDCESVDTDGRRVAIEVTELVDGDAIKVAKYLKNPFKWARWTAEKFSAALIARLLAKDAVFDRLKDGPYVGGYVVVVYSAEPELTGDAVRSFLQGIKLPVLAHATRGYLLLDYEPAIGRNPCFRIV